MARFVISLLVALLAVSSYGTVIHVPAQQPTIQAGVDAAVAGDTVLVSEGTYTGSGNRDVRILGKSIVVRSENGPSKAIIDCQGAGRAFEVRDGLGPGPVIEGFTIRNGVRVSAGGALVCNAFSVNVIACVFENNTASMGGAVAISNSNGDSEFSECVFKGNVATGSDESNGYGGAVSAMRAEQGVVFRKCVFADNSTHQGAALWCGRDGEMILENCSIVDNEAFVVGSAMASDYGGMFQVARSIVAFNVGSETVHLGNTSGSFSFSCTNIYGNSGGDWTGCIAGQGGRNGNFSRDPVFCDTESGDYSLDFQSPCVWWKSPCGQLTGAVGGSSCEYNQPLVVNLRLLVENEKRVTEPSPVIIWEYSDSLGVQSSYLIEVTTDPTFQFIDVWSSGAVSSGDTSVDYGGPALEAGQMHYMQARVSNGYQWGSWSPFAFRTNAVPTTPRAAYPWDGANVSDTTRNLVAHPSSDTDRDALSYSFELYTDTTAEPIWSKVGVVPDPYYPVAGPIPELELRVRYWWRARGTDGDTSSTWMPFSTFVVTNAAPTVPIAAFPPDGALLATSAFSDLRVYNSADADQDDLTYSFELYSDTASAAVWFRTGVPEGDDSTGSGPLPDLMAGVPYWWRVRSFDGDTVSAWMPFHMFTLRDQPSTMLVPTDVPSIQGAIDLAGTNDTILVEPGTHRENVDYRSKAIVLRSMAGRGQTTIRSRRDSLPVVQITYSRAARCVLDGFTITGSRNKPGVFIYESYVLLQNCDIHDCQNSAIGGGIYIENRASVEIANNLIHDNRAGWSGGGLMLSGTRNASVHHNRIYDNWGNAYGGMDARNADNDSPAEILFNVFYGNAVGSGRPEAVCLGYADYFFYRNTVAFNAGGLRFGGGSGSSCHSNIIAFNDDAGVTLTGGFVPSYNCVWENGPSDSLAYAYGIVVDPQFVDASSRDFGLLPSSYCVNAGHPGTVFNDPDGTPGDIGASYLALAQPLAASHRVAERRQDRVVSHRPRLEWSYYDAAGTGQAGYEVEVGTIAYPFTPDLWSSGAVISGDSGTTYDGLELMDGGRYYYRIRVSSPLGVGDWVYGTFQMNRRPPVPAFVGPADPVGASARSVQLLVLPVISPERDTITYDFALYGDSSLSDLIAATYGSDQPYSDFFGSLSPGVRYWWRARTHDGYEYSDWSVPVSFTARGSRSLIVPDEYATMQAAIDLASPGDTVLLQPGVFAGPGNRDLVLHGKGMIIRSIVGAQSTVLDCEGDQAEPHRAFHIDVPLDTPLVLEGLTVLNGYWEKGGAVISNGSPVRIRHCVFRGNGARNGGALYLTESQALIEDCLFDSNWSSEDGGAIYGAYGGSVVSNSRFTRGYSRSGSAIAHMFGSSITDCWFEENETWSGATVSASNASAVRCWFVGNSVRYPNGVCSGFARLDSCVFARNGGNGFAVSMRGSWMSPAFGKIDHCTFYGNYGVFSLWAALLEVSNSIIAFNNVNSVRCASDCFYDGSTGYIYCEDPGLTMARCDLYENAQPFDLECVELFTDMSDNITLDPRFCDTSGTDFELHLLSPCFGAGSDGTNIGAAGVGCGATILEPTDTLIPLTFGLSQNYPNPFNTSTTIEFSLASKTRVKVEIFNILGQAVRTLLDEERPANVYSVTWDGVDSGGRSVATGIYFYRMRAGQFCQTKKMLLLK